jgi:YHS domain-containing protein
VNLIVMVVRFVVAFLLIRLGLRFVAGVIRGLREPPLEGAAGVDMVRDRVCNTFVPRAAALTAVVGGHEMHFCSAACRDRALALPAGP